MNDPLQETAAAIDGLGQSAFTTVYGGVKIDEAAGTVDVLLTDLSPVVQARLSTAVAHPELLRLMRATYTYSYLRNLQHKIDTDWPQLAAEGIHVSSTGIGFGNVTVTVADTDPAVADQLRERYGDAVVVTLGQTIRTTATQTREGPPPYMGGMEIDDVGNPQLFSNNFYYYVCTAGFVGQNFHNGTPYYYIITAGHCFGDSSLIYHYYSAAGTWLPIGQVVDDWYQMGSNADAEAIASYRQDLWKLPLMIRC
jgi:hypothetical protein